MVRIKPGDKGRTYPGRLLRVVDGDTYDIEIDLGFHTTMKDRFRHAFVDTWEVRGPNKALGDLATDNVQIWFQEALDLAVDRDWPISVTTYKEDAQGKYGRWLCEVHNESQQDLGDFIRSVGGIKIIS